MGAPRKYPEKLKERATRMAIGARRDPATRAGAIARIADQLGVHREALRTWFAREEIDNGDRPGTTTDEAKRIAELERENRELRRANEILKTASAFSRQRSSTANCVTDSGLRECIRLSAAADTTVLDAAADRLVEACTRRPAATV